MQGSNADNLLAARWSERERHTPVKFLKVFPIVDLWLIQKKSVALIGNFPRPPGIFLGCGIDRRRGFRLCALLARAASAGQGTPSEKQDEAEGSFHNRLSLAKLAPRLERGA
jgi:hypothetical protein